MKKVLLGRVRNGAVEVQRFFKQDLAKIEGKEVEISPVEGGKTQQQLRYLWGVVYKIISEHTGFTSEEVSMVYKKKFLTYTKEYKGEQYKFTRGLSDLKKSEMAEFIDKVIKHATLELALIIPEPDEDFIYPIM